METNNDTPVDNEEPKIRVATTNKYIKYEPEFYDFIHEIRNTTGHEKIMHLSIFVDSDNENLKKLYTEAAEKHNKKISEDPHFYDAGFDLFVPDHVDYCSRLHFAPSKIDFKIKCCAKICDVNKIYQYQYDSVYTPFYTYARSSISKTPFRLANNQGIIDAGYRGNIIGMFDIINDTEPVWTEGTRLLQICAPGLVPIYVKIVDKLEDLGPATSRGEGGIGSTGQ